MSEKNGLGEQDWVQVIGKTEAVWVDSENFILEVTVAGKTCRFEGATVLDPKHFSCWFLTKFDFAIEIQECQWQYITSFWLDIAESKVLVRPKPVVQVPVPQRLWRRMGRHPDVLFQLFSAIAEAIGNADCWIALKPVPDSAYTCCQQHGRSHGG